MAVNLLERYFEQPKQSFKVGYPSIEQSGAVKAALAKHGAITAEYEAPRRSARRPSAQRSDGDSDKQRIWGKIPGKPSWDKDGRPLFKKSRRNKHLFTEESRLERVKLMREFEAAHNGECDPQYGQAEASASSTHVRGADAGGAASADLQGGHQSQRRQQPSREHQHRGRNVLEAAGAGTAGAEVGPKRSNSKHCAQEDLAALGSRIWHGSGERAGDAGA